MCDSAWRNFVLKSKFVRRIDIILQKLFNVSHFVRLELCVMGGALPPLSAENNFRRNYLLSPERMFAGWAATITDADFVFAPSACCADDQCIAFRAVD